MARRSAARGSRAPPRSRSVAAVAQDDQGRGVGRQQARQAGQPLGGAFAGHARVDHRMPAEGGQPFGVALARAPVP
jgi:hypothetical protein